MEEYLEGLTQLMVVHPYNQCERALEFQRNMCQKMNMLKMRRIMKHRSLRES
uniref:Uncharacterized protein n=1 Tax=Picea sitchensis TaxID=3332 RepID=A9NRM1_PICSI|nr:unknown [Picea sitchensis]